MTTITLLQVIRQTLQIARENPGFFYRDREVTSERCYYTHGPQDITTGDPVHDKGCIFGQGLEAAGVNVEYLVRADADAWNITDLLTRLIADGEVEDPSWGLRRVSPSLGIAQGLQDDGEPWRETVPYLERAERRLINSSDFALG